MKHTSKVSSWNKMRWNRLIRFKKKLLDTSKDVIEEDYPHEWDNLLTELSNGTQTNDPLMINHCSKIFSCIFKKCQFVNRQRSDDPVENVINTTFATLASMSKKAMDMFSTAMTKSNGNLTMQTIRMLQIMKTISTLLHCDVHGVFCSFTKYRWLRKMDGFIRCFFTIRSTKNKYSDSV